MNKKITIPLCIICFLLCLFFIEDTYAKYITSTNESASMNIARWRILVNNKDIRENSTTNAVITPIFNGNDNINSGIIAPNSEGYFDLIIDATEADVSFKYKIEISVNQNSPVKDLITTKYIIDNGNEIPLERNNATIENTVLHKDNTKPINIRVYIKWDDSNEATMDNDADTEATKQVDNPAKMDVKLSFIQLK
ncbi:MAG: hypothetical protein SPF04_04040 [Bacilli bacterium]|nr:hypothetical protein [Bacilli bacterium]MDY5996441.1 hypothetical protein [Bacilli bacterium]